MYCDTANNCYYLVSFVLCACYLLSFILLWVKVHHTFPGKGTYVYIDLFTDQLSYVLVISRCRNLRHGSIHYACAEISLNWSFSMSRAYEARALKPVMIIFYKILPRPHGSPISISIIAPCSLEISQLTTVWKFTGPTPARSPRLLVPIAKSAPSPWIHVNLVCWFLFQIW